MTGPGNPKWEPLPPLPVERWTGGLKAAFEIFAPQALWIASADQPVSVALLTPEAERVRVAGWKGGNPMRWERTGTLEDREDYRGPKGCWPVLLGMTGRQADRVTARLPKDPYVGWGLRRRVWTRGLDDSEDAWRLHDLLRDMLNAVVAQTVALEALPAPYINVGWLFDEQRDADRPRYYFEKTYVVPAAQQLGVWVCSEDRLRRFLTVAQDRAERRWGAAWALYVRDVVLDMVQEDASREPPHVLAAKGVRLPEHTRVPPMSAHGMTLKRAAYRTPEIDRQIEDKRRAP